MSDTTERTYTAADMRAAYKAGRYADIHQVEFEALRLYPDPLPPEPERRWVKTGGNLEYAREADGTWRHRRSGETDGRGMLSTVTDAHVLALASLLPRVPVTVTEEMKERAWKAYKHGQTNWRWTTWEGMCAALSAVASDLAQPVHACQHRATRWAVVDTQGGDAGLMHDTKQRAEDVRVDYDRRYADVRPHRVVGLAEVE